QLNAFGIGVMQFSCGMAKHTAAIGWIFQTRLIFDAVGSRVLVTDLGGFAVNVALAGQCRNLMGLGGTCVHVVTVCGCHCAVECILPASRNPLRLVGDRRQIVFDFRCSLEQMREQVGLDDFGCSPPSTGGDVDRSDGSAVGAP